MSKSAASAAKAPRPTSAAQKNPPPKPAGQAPVLARKPTVSPQSSPGSITDPPLRVSNNSFANNPQG